MPTRGNPLEIYAILDWMSHLLNSTDHSIQNNSAQTRYPYIIFNSINSSENLRESSATGAEDP